MGDGASPPNRFAPLAYDPSRAGRGPLLFAFLAVVPVFLLFGLWATLVPLNSAAIASGEIVVSSDRKVVQHLEGGLVTAIFVHEGARVEKGDPLLSIQDLTEQARSEALATELVNTNAQIARLIAERDGLDAPDFSAMTQGLSVPRTVADDFVATHLGVYANITQSMRSTIDLAQSRKVQIRREIEGQTAQHTAKGRELDLVRRDLAAKEELFSRSVISEVEVNALRREEADLAGQLGSLTAEMARLEQSLLDQDMEILRVRNDREQTMLGELQAATIAAEKLRQELRTLTDRQARAVLRAPASGLVMGVEVQTIGAVVSPGTVLMEVVPDAEDLIIEARVKPTDIDLVEPGMTARVQLSAFKTRNLDRLDATVETVSGDILTDRNTGERYFLARLSVGEAALSALPANVVLSPGMPAEVFLIAGTRTMAQYLVSPITDAAYRAFREE